tara:strand:+ start:83 stop:469 length:387 start_codon:yes stop_codon:yes gene_type:complete
MAAVSGLNGYVTVGSCTVASLTDCDLTYGSPNEEFFTVNGAGSSNTVATAKRGSGTMNLVLDDAALFTSVAESGELVALVFYSKTGGDSAIGNGRIGQVQTTFNLEGTVERVTVPFMTDGVWTGTLVT